VTTRSRPAPFRPRLEALEDRCLLSVDALDLTFGNGGKVTTDFLAPSDDVARAVAVQADGKIVVAGTAGSSFALARYETDGTLDPTFDSDGKVTAGFSGYAYAVAVQPIDGKILVAGSTGFGFAGDFLVARFNANGSLDTSFGSGGQVITDFSGRNYTSDERVYAVMVKSDGKIVVAGSTGVNIQYNGPPAPQGPALARYNPNGSLDGGFGSGGKVVTDISGGFVGFPVLPVGAALQTDGKIVVAESNNLFRYTAAGKLDKTFDGDGKAPPLEFNTARAVAIWDPGTPTNPSDDKIVVGGNSYTNAGGDFMLWRYNANGSRDASFDGDGMVVTDFGSDWDYVNSIVVQADGKIVAAGGTHQTGGVDAFALARYNANGSLDASFDGDGKVITSFSPDVNPGQTFDLRGAHGVALQADRKIVVAGETRYADTGYDFALARYHGDESASMLLAGGGAAPGQVNTETLTQEQVQPVLAEALARWEAASVDTSQFGAVEVRIADLPEGTLGMAEAGVIWLDANAAGWGWFVDPTPGDDSEFTTPGNQGEQGKKDLLTVLMHEIGHQLGYEHSAGRVMEESLAAGTRRMPSSA
jgi:uncharacterized delta-60 repeat protein